MKHKTIILQLPFQRTLENPPCVNSDHNGVWTNRHTANLPVRMDVWRIRTRCKTLQIFPYKCVDFIDSQSVSINQHPPRVKSSKLTLRRKVQLSWKHFWWYTLAWRLCSEFLFPCTKHQASEIPCNVSFCGYGMYIFYGHWDRELVKVSASCVAIQSIFFVPYIVGTNSENHEYCNGNVLIPG